jgi:hypothetical protein
MFFKSKLLFELFACSKIEVFFLLIIELNIHINFAQFFHHNNIGPILNFGNFKELNSEIDIRQLLIVSIIKIT